MANSLDFNLLPLARFAGQDQPDLVGLSFSEPPRRTARGRNSDLLLLYFVLGGNAPLSSGKQEQVLAHLAQTYYKTSGSVTAALRTVAESLNQFLLDRNLKNASSGRQGVGQLTLLALRGGQLYLSQSGPMHAFLITAEQTQHLYDPQISGRGLGLSRTTPIRYFQAVLQPKDTLLLASQPSPTWSETTLRNAHGLGLDSLRRRLLSRSDLEVNALIVQAGPGSGKFHLVVSQTPAAPAAPEPPIAAGPLPDLTELEAGPPPPEASLPPEENADSPSAPSGPSKEEPETSSPDVNEFAASQPEEPNQAKEAEIPPEVGSAGAAPTETIPSTEAIPPWEELPQAGPSQVESESIFEPPASPAHPATASLPLHSPEPAGGVSPEAFSGESVPAASSAHKPLRAPRKSLNLKPVWHVLVAIGRPFAMAFALVLRGLRILLLRMLPDESLLALPSSLMAFVAIAVPLVIVAMASVVYIKEGRATQYEVYFNRAQQAAQQASAQSDLQMQRLVWQATLGYLDQAESYGATDESRALRLQAQQALDDMDLVRRPNYQPAIIGGLQEGVRVVQLLPAQEDLYLLDASGNVQRGRITNNQDYEIDPSFLCGPGYYNEVHAGGLIKIAAIPPGDASGATLLGMDTTGDVLFCAPGKEPVAATLAQPDTAENWGSLVGFAYDPDTGNLFVLDPQDKTVWAYWGRSFNEQPDYFFGDQAPDIQDVVDMAVDKKDLYLLHADGHLTLCTYSDISVSPTRCEDPAYVDARPGNQGQALVPDSPFRKVLTTQPPDPSLYLLEPESQAIYHFSLRTLNFHRQFLPSREIAKGAATAFAVDPLQRILYLAIGNRVFQASIP